MTRNKVGGPYEIISVGVPDGKVLQKLDWAEVRGATLLVTCSDNFAQLQPNANNATYWAIAEVAVWGVVQGYEACLKRQQIRMASGPMTYIFADEDTYDSIQVRARNQTGGHRANPGASGVNAPTAANGFSLKVQLFIQPRGGFAR